jgi:hypothetical protein
MRTGIRCKFSYWNNYFRLSKLMRLVDAKVFKPTGWCLSIRRFVDGYSKLPFYVYSRSKTSSSFGAFMPWVHRINPKRIRLPLLPYASYVNSFRYNIQKRDSRKRI